MLLGIKRCFLCPEKNETSSFPLIEMKLKPISDLTEFSLSQAQ